MRGELITDLEGVAEIEADWRRLAEARGNAFLTPDWYRAWAGDPDQSPMIAVARRESGALAGVLPLVHQRGSRPRSARFPGSSFGDRFGIAASREDEGAVAAAAVSSLQSAPGGAPMLVLHRVDADAEWPEAMAAASAPRLALIERGRAQLPHVIVRGLDWDDYLAQRSQKFRQRIGRGLERALEREGIGFSIRETTDPGELEGDMALLFRLHDLRHSGDESSITAPAVRDSLTAFARAALGHGWLRLRFLEIEGAPAAAYLAWRLGPAYAVYQSGFDPAFAEHSAGMLLLNDTVRSAIGEHADDVDLLLGAEAFKWRFAPDPREVSTLILVGAHRPARLLAEAERTARRHGRGLASRPLVGRFARRLARLLPGAG